MIASGEAVSASAHAFAPPSASRTYQRKLVRISLSLCRKLRSALAIKAVRGRIRILMGKAEAVQLCIEFSFDLGCRFKSVNAPLRTRRLELRDSVLRSRPRIDSKRSRLQLESCTLFRAPCESGLQAANP